MKLTPLILATSISIVSVLAVAKLPPAAAEDPKAAAEKAEKAKVGAEKAKALQTAAEERSVKNFQANMKKAGRPVPKPTPIALAQTPPKAVTAAAKAAPAKTLEKPTTKK